MAGVPGRQKFVLAHKRPLRVVVILLAAAALAVPLLVVGLGPGGFAGASYTALRLFALYAFTLIFMEIVTGAARAEFYMLFKPLRVYRFHIAAGAAGFGMALAHGLIVLFTGSYRAFSAVWLIGPVTLGLLCVTVYVALDKHRLSAVWRRIHQLNYLIFVAVFVKAVIIGSDVRTPTASARFMLVVMVLYMAIAALAVVVRVMDHEALARGGGGKARQTGEQAGRD